MSSRPLSETEYNTIVDHLAIRPRDLLLLILGCSSGYRITELLSLKWQQVWDAETGTARKEVLVARRNLKGGAGLHCRSVHSRRVPLNDRACVVRIIPPHRCGLFLPIGGGEKVGAGSRAG